MLKDKHDKLQYFSSAAGSLSEATDPVTSEMPSHGLSCYIETYEDKQKVAVQATLEKFNFS